MSHKHKPKPGHGGPGSHNHYDEAQHPRDAHGHWITTTGGHRRFKRGTPAQRARFAKQIRGARKRATTRGARRKLAAQVRAKRAKQLGKPTGGGKTTRAKPAKQKQGASQAQGGKPISHKDIKSNPHVLAAEKASKASGAQERAYTDLQEQRAVLATHGDWYQDSQPMDGLTNNGRDALEIKSILTQTSVNRTTGKPSPTQLTVHPGAEYRKTVDARQNDRTYQTIVFDKRDLYENGAHAEHYSGHEIYYKRAVGPYDIAKMYKVKDINELRTLIATPNNKLPSEARGTFKKGAALKELKARADKDKAYNDARSKASKAKKGAAAYRRQGEGADNGA